MGAIGNAYKQVLVIFYFNMSLELVWTLFIYFLLSSLVAAKKFTTTAPISRITTNRGTYANWA